MGLITDVPEPVPPSRLSAWFSAWAHRPSAPLFMIAVALAILALALTVNQRQLRRAFAEPSTTSMGVVRSGGALLGSSRRSNEVLCYVSYQFSPPGGALQRNWRLWGPGCGVSKGRPILIQYVIAHPEINRPAGEDSGSSPFFVWFAAGMMLVIASLVMMARDGG
jgi:hypothetical protein